MLSAVIIVLREALEAALIVSILLALSQVFHLRHRWCSLALVLGAGCSWLLASNANTIAELFDGAGQELVSAVLLIVMVVCLFFICAFMVLKIVRPSRVMADEIQSLTSYPLFLYLLLTLVVICATAREGAEVWVYLTSFTPAGDGAYPVLLGAAIGAGIGVSLGAIFYYAFLFMGRNHFAFVSIVILTIVAGGLGFQVAREFMQIGWLDSAEPVWNSSAIISERSLTGELLYALIGYEATPTPIQLVFYLVSIFPFICLGFLYRYLGSEQKS